MIQLWKVPHILKGMLTWVPVLNTWRLRHTRTGGSDSARYCYSVWLRHLVTLQSHGFRIRGGRVGELGPGDSIGTGLAALLSGADYYIGLDLLPYSASSKLEEIFEDLVQLYARKEPIPDDSEFPRIRPRLDSYEFPDYAVDWLGFNQRIERIRTQIRKGLEDGQMIRYQAPWTSISDITPESLDLIFSQAVLEYIAPLDEVYRAMALWLKPGCYASHSIDLSAHYLSPYWNGHWAYSDWEWRLARGRREFFLNRQPLKTHLAYAKKFAFEIVLLKREDKSDGLPLNTLSRRFQSLDSENLRTCGAFLILRKGSHELHS